MSMEQKLLGLIALFLSIGLFVEICVWVKRLFILFKQSDVLGDSIEESD